MKGLAIVCASSLVCLVSVTSYAGDKDIEPTTLAALQPRIAPLKLQDIARDLNYSRIPRPPVKEACGGNYAACTSDSQCCGGRICTGGHCCCQ